MLAPMEKDPAKEIPMEKKQAVKRNMRPFMLKTGGILLAISMLLLPSSAFAGDAPYPTKPVRLIVPFGPIQEAILKTGDQPALEEARPYPSMTTVRADVETMIKLVGAPTEE